MTERQDFDSCLQVTKYCFSFNQTEISLSLHGKDFSVVEERNNCDYLIDELAYFMPTSSKDMSKQEPNPMTDSLS